MQRDLIQQVLRILVTRFKDSREPMDPDMLREFRELSQLARQPGDYEKLERELRDVRRDLDALQTVLAERGIQVK
jgi:hypothetical protein